jgi:probable HAF family extracellular repeat protein
MKSRILVCVTAMAFLAALAPSWLSAQQHTRYNVIDLGTLGGTFSWAQGLNNRGQASGFSTLPEGNRHGLFWQDGVITDLGTLGGPNSTAFGISASDEIAGFAETSTPDPLGEDFFGSGNHLISLPFVWQNGVMTTLPTLGGNNGAAVGINNQGQVVGEAENATPDPTCAGPQVLQVKPVIWTKGKVQELPTFPGDPKGLALNINGRGQAVGWSGDCITGGVHALLWDKGTVTDLGNLGGTINNFALNINYQGQVVGNSALPGNTTDHAFLWEDGVMTDLGTLPGDVGSGAGGINSKRQVTGISCDVNFDCRAFLWQNGVMTGLNDLIPANSPLFLINAGGINARGQIAGLAFQTSTGEFHAFLATPMHGGVASESTTAAAHRRGRKIILPENVRKMLRQRLDHRYHIPDPAASPPD